MRRGALGRHPGRDDAGLGRPDALRGARASQRADAGGGAQAAGHREAIPRLAGRPAVKVELLRGKEPSDTGETCLRSVARAIRLDGDEVIETRVYRGNADVL